jgi:hypothetical protein
MAPARAALVLRRVHRLGPVFRSRFDGFSMIRGYFEILYKLQMPPPEDYYVVRREAEAVRRVYAAAVEPVVGDVLVRSNLGEEGVDDDLTESDLTGDVEDDDRP